ncbi:cytochrome P450 [Crossiella cryophila]|uniref:Cytochrome P450 n=1 Tax=Crossiella cryophila TaxID=43355 RepID=A0A7W7CF32_9PSEU|nr:cytochrome P450 [Crossiella cryophila]MBB4679920.1 cytochrome P450 [Crossiella cryophila]
MTHLGTAAALRLGLRIRTEFVLGRVLGACGDQLAQLAWRRSLEDPYPLYERIRRRGPLHRQPGGAWATTSYELARQVLRDRRFGVPIAPGRLPLTSVNRYFPRSIVQLDPPEHTQLRRVVAPAFAPARMTEYRAGLRRTVHDLLDQLAGQDQFDLITDLATPLAVALTGDLLGIQPTDRSGLAEYSLAVGSNLGGVRSAHDAEELLTRGRDLTAQFDRLLTANPPTAEVPARLATAMAEGRMTTAEAQALLLLLVAAGIDTSVGMIGNAVHALLRNPDQWALLCAQPELAPRAVEEALRYDPAAQLTARLAHEDVELAGQVIKAGQVVFVLIAAANRDPLAYSAPNRFDLTRQHEPDNLAFANGIHFCLGASLARLEGEVLFRALAERMPSLRLAGRPRRLMSTGTRAFEVLPVTNPASRGVVGQAAVAAAGRG